MKYFYKDDEDDREYKEVTLEMLKEYLKECNENIGNYYIPTITLYKVTTDALYFVHEIFEC
jgi:hypothetical protein